MKKKRVIILGGGVSGLSLAWYLTKYSEHLDIVLLEKSERLGGWVHSERVNGFLFERGPHTFRNVKSNALKELAIAIGLEKQLIFSQDVAKKRYLYLNKKLKLLPKWLLLKSLLHEWKVPCDKKEESVYEFAFRRFSQQVADLFFDPMSIGIYAGDSKQLSINACFPFFKNLEEKYGSVSKGLLKSFVKNIGSSAALFSFQEGVSTLIDAMKVQIKGEINYNQEVKRLRIMKDSVEVQTEDQIWKGDHLFCALPSSAAKQLFSVLDPQMGLLLDIPVSSVSVVNVGYKSRVLPIKGFGYLVPSIEQQEVLGVMFDSEIFPQQNYYPEETRLTVMLKKGQNSIETAKKILREHLNITSSADAMISTDANIPQYVVGHIDKIKRLKKHLKDNFPSCTLLGNYLEGVSVNDCIQFAQGLSKQDRMGFISNEISKTIA